MAAADIRALRVEDAPLVAAIEAAGADRPWSAEAVARALASSAVFGLVAWVEGDAVGHLLGSAVEDEGEIFTITVLPRVRRGGIARRLLVTCEARWRGSGVEQAWLEVRSDNVAALALYRGAGWVDAGLRRGYYHDGADAVRMRWGDR